MFINEFALTSEQRTGLYFALGCHYGEKQVEYPELKEESSYSSFRTWIDSLTSYHVCITGANSKLDYAVAVVRAYIMYCHSVTPPDNIPVELAKAIIDDIAVYVNHVAQLQYETAMSAIRNMGAVEL